jgi:SAM-dependent methyltransferase
MTTARKITYLSAPAEVRMGDLYFDIASLDHFWIRRRFKVLQQFAGDLVSGARAIAEIGCGSGMLQRQIEDAYGKEVAGFDLNEVALKKNASRLSAVHCYNIFEKHSTLRERFDIILLFDVLEHIPDDKGFLEALNFHLAPGGRLILNVPACPWAYSEYDKAGGHERRYSIRTLCDAVEAKNLRITKWTFWGLPLVPTILARKLYLRGKKNQDEIISCGFDAGSKSINQLLGLLAKCELIPQKLIGTSLMAVLQDGSRGKRDLPSN